MKKKPKTWAELSREQRTAVLAKLEGAALAAEFTGIALPESFDAAVAVLRAASRGRKGGGR